MIDAHTALLGVVGHPVRHSLSPAFWNAALRHEGRNAVFLAFDVAADDFRAFVEGMRAARIAGLNVTLPHKASAFELCSQRSEEAAATGAVNVLTMSDGSLSGANTDVFGVAQAVVDLGVELSGSRALVVGAGGAGRAAVLALERMGADVSITNRTSARAADVGVAQIEWQDMPSSIGDFDLLVHTTSVGLDGTSSVLEEADLRNAAVGRLRAVLDVVYRPDETPLVRAARGANLQAADGLRILVHQAGEAWRVFFGEPAPLAVMHSAAAEAAGRLDRS